MPSIEASKLFEDESLDFVFIDGAHDYESVKQDLEHWYPKIKTGGWLGGDDLHLSGVREATDEFFQNIGQKYRRVPDMLYLHRKGGVVKQTVIFSPAKRPRRSE